MSKGDALFRRWTLNFPAAGRYEVTARRPMLLQQVNANTNVHTGPPMAVIGIQCSSEFARMVVTDSVVWKSEASAIAGKPAIVIKAEEPGEVTVGVMWVEL